MTHRTLALGIVAAALAASSGHPAAAQASRSGDTDVPSVTITATDYRFSPAEIHATAGRSLRLTLINKGTEVHGLRLLLSTGEWPFPRNVPPGETDTAVVDSVGEPGRHSFYCPVDDHQGHGMIGVLIVEPAK